MISGRIMAPLHFAIPRHPVHAILQMCVLDSSMLMYGTSHRDRTETHHCFTAMLPTSIFCGDGNFATPLPFSSMPAKTERNQAVAAVLQQLREEAGNFEDGPLLGGMQLV